MRRQQPLLPDTLHLARRSASHGALHQSYSSQSVIRSSATVSLSSAGGLRAANENAMLLPSPGPLESMLKTTTETGDIGQFSIKPIPPSGAASGFLLRNSGTDDEIFPRRHDSQRTISLTSQDDRLRLPSYRDFRRDTASEIISMYGSDSQYSASSSISRRPGDSGPRAYSMTSCSSQPPLPNQKSTGTLQSQSSGQRPRSPFPYPTRLRRPGVRPSSPALGTDGVVDYSKMVQIDRAPLQTSDSFGRTPSYLLLNGMRQKSHRSSHSNDGQYTGVQPAEPDRHSTAQTTVQRRHASTEHSRRIPSASAIAAAHRAAASRPGALSPKSPGRHGGSFYYDYTEDFEYDHGGPVLARTEPLAPTPTKIPRLTRPKVLDDADDSRSPRRYLTSVEETEAAAEAGMYEPDYPGHWKDTPLPYPLRIPRSHTMDFTEYAKRSREREAAEDLSSTASQVETDDPSMDLTVLAENEEFQPEDSEESDEEIVGPTTTVSNSKEKFPGSSGSEQILAEGPLEEVNYPPHGGHDELHWAQDRTTDEVELANVEPQFDLSDDPFPSHVRSLPRPVGRCIESSTAGYHWGLSRVLEDEEPPVSSQQTTSPITTTETQSQINHPNDSRDSSESNLAARRNRRTPAPLRISISEPDARDTMNVIARPDFNRSRTPMLAPTPLSPSQDLRVKDSIPQLMKELPPLPGGVRPSPSPVADCAHDGAELSLQFPPFDLSMITSPSSTINTLSVAATDMRATRNAPRPNHLPELLNVPDSGQAAVPKLRLKGKRPPTSRDAASMPNVAMHRRPPAGMADILGSDVPAPVRSKLRLKTSRSAVPPVQEPSPTTVKGLLYRRGSDNMRYQAMPRPNELASQTVQSGMSGSGHGRELLPLSSATPQATSFDIEKENTAHKSGDSVKSNTPEMRSFFSNSSEESEAQGLKKRLSNMKTKLAESHSHPTEPPTSAQNGAGQTVQTSTLQSSFDKVELVTRSTGTLQMASAPLDRLSIQKSTFRARVSRWVKAAKSAIRSTLLSRGANNASQAKA